MHITLLVGKRDAITKAVNSAVAHSVCGVVGLASLSSYHCFCRDSDSLAVYVQNTQKYSFMPMHHHHHPSVPDRLLLANQDSCSRQFHTCLYICCHNWLGSNQDINSEFLWVHFNKSGESFRAWGAINTNQDRLIEHINKPSNRERQSKMHFYNVFLVIKWEALGESIIIFQDWVAELLPKSYKERN